MATPSGPKALACAPRLISGYRPRSNQQQRPSRVSTRPLHGDRVPAIAANRVIQSSYNWQDGEIAYLKGAKEMTFEDHKSLSQTGYLQEKACGHPVVILKRAATHVIVTPVSAFSSSKDNHFLAPWKKDHHCSRNPINTARNFRSFEGSELSQNLPILKLRDGRKMPKPQTSWINIQSAWVVPLTAIDFFNKVWHYNRNPHGTVLRMTDESLRNLRGHFMAASPNCQDCRVDPRLQHQNPDPQHLQAALKFIPQAPVSTRTPATKNPVGPAVKPQLRTTQEVVTSPKRQPVPTIRHTLVQVRGSKQQTQVSVTAH